MSTDLTTTKGGDIPLDNTLETASGSKSGFEKKEELCSSCGKDREYHRTRMSHPFNMDVNESFANEESLATVGGAPDNMSANDPQFRKKENDALVLPEGKFVETLPNDDDPLWSDKLGENLQYIKLNENYIQDQFGVFYKPVYIGEKYIPHPSDLIFENKIYTTEGLGNCVFCHGAGKVTVENLGLKDCPNCDGTGDTQSQAPMGDPNAMVNPMDPNAQQAPPLRAQTQQQPNGGAPEDPSKTPKKNPKYDEESMLQGKENYATEDDGWITVNGTHIKVKAGQSKKEATQDFIDSKSQGKPTLKQKVKNFGKKPKDSSEDPQTDDSNYPKNEDDFNDQDDTGNNMRKDADLGNPEDDDLDPSENKYPSTSNYPDKELSKRVDDELETNKSIKNDLNGNNYKIQRGKKSSLKLTGDPMKDLTKLSRFHQGDIVEIKALSKGQKSKLYNMMLAEPDFGINGSNEQEMESFWNGMSPNERTAWGVYSKDDDGKPLAEKEWNELSGNLSTRNAKGHVLEGGFGDKGLYGMIVNKGNDPTMGDYWIKLWKKKRGQTVPNEDDNDFTFYDEDENDRTGESKKKSDESFAKVVESCGGCKTKAQESINNYKSFINMELVVLKGRARIGEAVNIMYGLPTVTRQGKKIKGTLAYAGVSLNDRIYLPEELAKGHGKTLPLLLNHSSIAGAEEELDRLSDEMLDCLYNEKDFQVGEVTLTWDPAKLTLYYEGVIENKFFQKEVDEMDMAVSLGIYYDSDSPKVCDENCYTLIKGAEFREVSLVYHAGFPIATIEAVEAQLKESSRQAIEKEEIQHGAGTMHDKGQIFISKTEPVKEEAEEELDVLLPNEQPIDVKVKASGDSPEVIDIGEDAPIFAESLITQHNFSVRGVSGMTISNSNGVERYTLDPSMNYGTNMVHFDVPSGGSQIFGEAIQLQPKMTTPASLTKEIEKHPDIKFTDADEDSFKKKTKLTESQVFDEQEHPRDSDGKFTSGGRKDRKDSIIQGQIDYLKSQFRQESQDYTSFQKVIDNDHAVRWYNKKLKEKIGKLQEDMAEPDLEGLPTLHQLPNTHEPKTFKNSYIVNDREGSDKNAKTSNITTNDLTGFKSNITNITFSGEIGREYDHITKGDLDRQLNITRLMWNDLPDETRDYIKNFKIERTPELQTKVDGMHIDYLNMEDVNTMGYWIPSKKDFVIRVDDMIKDSDLKGTITHEAGHVEWHMIKENHPEKIEAWIKATSKLAPPTIYAKTNKKRWDAMQKLWDDEVENGFKSIPEYHESYQKLTPNERKDVVASNLVISKNRYYNELHSEVHMYMMGHTKTKTKTGKVTKTMENFANAYKELHGL